MPQRDRGRERRETVINAACAILAEQGEDGVSLRAVAQRAQTSIGSMYHFFADREQLLRAVAQRHGEALVKITAPTLQIRAESWRSMSAAEVIRALFHGPLNYFLAHADALAVHHRQGANNSVDFQKLLLRIMRARLGEEAGPAVAATLYAVSTGTLFFLREMQSTSMADTRVSIEDVLIAVLEKAEAGRQALA